MAPAERWTAIVMIRHSDPPGAVRHPAGHGVIVDYRPGFVRVSPHFSNAEEEIDRCVEVLARRADVTPGQLSLDNRVAEN